MVFLMICTSRLHDITLSLRNLPIMPLPSSLSFSSLNLKHAFSVTGAIFPRWESFVIGGAGEGCIRKISQQKCLSV